ncbi:MAG: hypothetical protein NC910_01225 [Candidatus Omnitrophica bacterium]|nr:hypothetical protein [Candidatus Omnitrophota bacterium]
MRWLIAPQKFLFRPETRLFWMVGLLGAFTMFSAFICESRRLMQDGEFALAGMNLMGGMLPGVVALWVGHVVASIL